MFQQFRKSSISRVVAVAAVLLALFLILVLLNGQVFNESKSTGAVLNASDDTKRSQVTIDYSEPASAEAESVVIYRNPDPDRNLKNNSSPESTPVNSEPKPIRSLDEILTGRANCIKEEFQRLTSGLDPEANQSQDSSFISELSLEAIEIRTFKGVRLSNELKVELRQRASELLRQNQQDFLAVIVKHIHGFTDLEALSVVLTAVGDDAKCSLNSLVSQFSKGLPDISKESAFVRGSGGSESMALMVSNVDALSIQWVTQSLSMNTNYRGLFYQKEFLFRSPAFCKKLIESEQSAIYLTRFFHLRASLLRPGHGFSWPSMKSELVAVLSQAISRLSSKKASPDGIITQIMADPNGDTNEVDALSLAIKRQIWAKKISDAQIEKYLLDYISSPKTKMGEISLLISVARTNLSEKKKTLGSDSTWDYVEDLMSRCLQSDNPYERMMLGGAIIAGSEIFRKDRSKIRYFVEFLNVELSRGIDLGDNARHDWYGNYFFSIIKYSRHEAAQMLLNRVQLIPTSIKERDHIISTVFFTFGLNRKSNQSVSHDLRPNDEEILGEIALEITRRFLAQPDQSSVNWMHLSLSLQYLNSSRVDELIDLLVKHFNNVETANGQGQRQGQAKQELAKLNAVIDIRKKAGLRN